MKPINFQEYRNRQLSQARAREKERAACPENLMAAEQLFTRVYQVFNGRDIAPLERQSGRPGPHQG